ncbi:ABC transporter ATP-binding protein [Pseudomonas tohonis]|nr:spermidine/putrescine ABC transporter ATP-binding protein [Pseudomonas alcaligenes OT 69]MDN4143695.1 ABC transporter ATP-binding protein [Pseudomonas tohonis]
MNALHAVQTAAVSIRSVRKVYGDPQSGPVALKHVDLEIRDNEFFTLLGPSGCGKTTLLRMIAGFEYPSAGSIHLYGEDIADLPPYERPVNTVFQHYALFPHMTIAENLAFGLESRPLGKSMSRVQVAERVAEMFALVQMERFADRRPTQLSGGQQQRVALARALAPHPRVLLLDEPLSALDLKLRQAMREELKAIQTKTGITFIFVTHDQEEALTLSDRIAVFSEGQVQQVGTPQEIYERPRNRFVADFIGETNFLDAQVLSLDGTRALCQGPGGQPFQAESVDGVLPGSRVSLSIRPERVHLGGVDTAGALPCRVEAQVYLGTDLQYRVSLDDGTRLTVRMPNSLERHHRFGVGERAALQFENGSASVLLD